MQTTRSFASRIPADAFRVAAGIGFAVLVYFALEFVTWRAYYAMECEKMFSSTCMSLLQVKHIVAAALPAYLAARWIGRLGIVLGATVSLGGWLTVNLFQALFGPNSFDAWHLVGNYLVIGGAGWRYCTTAPTACGRYVRADIAIDTGVLSASVRSPAVRRSFPH